MEEKISQDIRATEPPLENPLAKPIETKTTPGISCTNCGFSMLARSCKLRCPRCGFFEDCSDTGLPTY